MDAQRAMLDELMGSARDMTEEERKAYREPRWEDRDVCSSFLVRFCPHDLFVNTRSNLGPCPKVHDLKLRESFQKSKRHDEFVPIFEERLAQFCERLLLDMDRKVQRGHERIAEEFDEIPHTVSSEKSEQLSVLEEKIKKLLEQVEMLGEAGEVDEAEAMMKKVDALNAVKNSLTQQSSNKVMLTQEKKMALSILEENIKKLLEQVEMLGEAGKVDEAEALMRKVDALTAQKKVLTQQSIDRVIYAQQKKMALCETCGSIMIASDATERKESHITGRQHIGYALMRDFLTEYKASKEKAREEKLARKKEVEERRQRDEHESRDSRRDGHGERERYHSERERSRGWSGRGDNYVVSGSDWNSYGGRGSDWNSYGGRGSDWNSYGGRGSDWNYDHRVNGRDWDHQRSRDRNGVLPRDRARKRSKSLSPDRRGYERSSRRQHY